MEVTHKLCGINFDDFRSLPVVSICGQSSRIGDFNFHPSNLFVLRCLWIFGFEFHPEVSLDMFAGGKMGANGVSVWSWS